jgi:hypothetical protein
LAGPEENYGHTKEKIRRREATRGDGFELRIMAMNSIIK